MYLPRKCCHSGNGFRSAGYVAYVTESKFIVITYGWREKQIGTKVYLAGKDCGGYTHGTQVLGVCSQHNDWEGTDITEIVHTLGLYSKHVCLEYIVGPFQR